MDDSRKVGKAETDYRDKDGKTVTVVKTSVGKNDEPKQVEKLVISRRVEK